MFHKPNILFQEKINCRRNLSNVDYLVAEFLLLRRENIGLQALRMRLVRFDSLPL